ncbi:MAG: ATP-binding protein [Planctomycetota bacterium]
MPGASASPSADGLPLPPSSRRPWLIYVLFLLAFGLVTLLYQRHEAERFRTEAESRILSIANLMRERIVTWRRERFQDAQFLQQKPAFAGWARDWFADPRPEKEAPLRMTLDALREAEGYRSAFLLDSEGRVRLALGDLAAEAMREEMSRLFRRSRATRRVLFGDFHRAQDRVRVEVVAPLSVQEGKRTEFVGAVILGEEVSEDFYPLLPRWPVPSATSELLLARMDDGEALYLNGLRHVKGPALGLRRPIGKADPVLAQAVEGFEGVLEAPDYRGASVLAATLQIPNTPWILVAKTDAAEVYAPLRIRTRLLFAVAISLALLAGMSVRLYASIQAKAFYRQLNEERAAGEAALRASEERARRFLNIAPAIILALDREGRIALLNHAGSAVLECPWEESGGGRSDAQGLDWVGTFIPAPDRDRVRGVLARLLAGDLAGLEFVESNVVTRKGGVRRILWHNTILMNDAGIIGTLSSGQDITEHKELEEQLRQAQKMESLGLLAGGIAHDFNNLLMVILGNLEIAGLDIAPGAPVRASLNRVEAASKRAADLCREMLVFSGRGQFELRALDLAALVRDMTQLLDVSLAKKAVLRLDFPKDLPPIEGDETQVRQIIMNLILNAAEAQGADGGEVLLSAKAALPDPGARAGLLLGSNLADGPSVCLEVADTGCGMDKETQARIFEPFFTTKAKGRGLGLAAVLGIVRGHRGAIGVESERGKGTRIRVFFPASSRPVEAEAVEEALTDWRGTGTILLVDDESSVLDTGRRFLRRLGFEVVAVESGALAVEAFRAAPGSFRAVLTDFTMPGMDGHAAGRALRGIRPDVPLILSSGFPERLSAVEEAEVRFEAFLQKPYGIRELANVLRRVLEG